MAEDPDFHGDAVCNMINSGTGADLTWALSSLPLRRIPNPGQPYVAFASRLKDDPSLQVSNIFAEFIDAIGREVKYPVISENDRLAVAIPMLLSAATLGMTRTLLHILQDECALVTSRLGQFRLFEFANALLDNGGDSHISSAVAIIATLCETGAAIPLSLLNLLMSMPAVLEKCLYPVLCSVRDYHGQTRLWSVVRLVLDSELSRCEGVNALIQFVGLPDAVVPSLCLLIRLEIANPEMIRILMQHSFRVLSQKFISEKELYQAVIQGCRSDFVTLFSDGLIAFLEGFVPRLDKSDAELLFKTIVENRSFCNCTKIVSMFLRRSVAPDFIDLALPLLLDASSMFPISDWLVPYELLINTDLHAANSLTSALLEHAARELKDGHPITKPDGRLVVTDHQLRARGYREIDIIFRALSHSQCKKLVEDAAFELLTQAASLHGQAIAAGVSALLLALLHLVPEVCRFLMQLSEGNSSLQMLFLLLSLELRQCKVRRSMDSRQSYLRWQSIHGSTPSDARQSGLWRWL
jgi:hypothetical protein